MWGFGDWKAWIAWAVAGSAGFLVAQLNEVWGVCDTAIGTLLATLDGSAPSAFHKLVIICRPLNWFLPVNFMLGCALVVVGVYAAFAVFGILLRVIKWVTDVVPTGG